MQISPRICPLFLLVSDGTGSRGALLVTFRSVNVSIQLHRKPSNQHQDITERYVFLHTLGTSLHHIVHNIHERVTLRTRRRPHGCTKFLHRFARLHRYQRRPWRDQCRRESRDVVTKSTLKPRSFFPSISGSILFHYLSRGTTFELKTSMKMIITLQGLKYQIRFAFTCTFFRRKIIIN